MDHIGLFAGGGGFELAIQGHGGKTIAFSEIDSFCRRILKYWFPEAEDLGDIDNINFKKYANKIDILTGGFPCQPFSLSGERAGEKDDRYKWPEMFRAIQETRTPWVVAENVLGIVNWSEGVVFEKVQSDLENEGYQVLPFILPAISVGALHERQRCWFIGFNPTFQMEREKFLGKVNTSDSSSFRRVRLCDNIQSKQSKMQCSEPFNLSSIRNEIPTYPPLCSMDNGLPRELDGITFSQWRGKSVEMFGNAIFPQLFEMILNTIEEYKKNTK